MKYFALTDRSRAASVIQRLTSESPSGKHPAEVLPVVVSDRIVAGAREQFRTAGVSWFDLRGHLYLKGPGVLIDVDTNTETTPTSGDRNPLGGRVGLATALDILLTHPPEVAIRETARRIGASPSTVSTVVRALRDEGVVDERGAVDLTALFWATAAAWKPRWVPVDRYPHPEGPLRNPALMLGLDAPGEPGWALGGDLAAAELGAPIGLASGSPPDLFVPTKQAHRLACSILGVTRDGGTPAARLAVAPAEAVCTHRVTTTKHSDHWLTARPLFVALDLAQDQGRGVEILEGWDSPVGYVRVW